MINFPKARYYMARSASVRVEVFADLHADVGEAPHWDERTKTLLFVDLTAGMVFRYDRSGVKLGSFPVGQEVGAVVPRRPSNSASAGLPGAAWHGSRRPGRFSYERYAVYPANGDAGMPTAPGRHTNVAPACGSFFSWPVLSR